MATELEPIIGEWYLYSDRGQIFTVVDVDETEDLVEIELANGKLQHIDLATWYELDLEVSEEPEEWLDEDAESLGPDADTDLDDVDLDDWGEDPEL